MTPRTTLTRKPGGMLLEVIFDNTTTVDSRTLHIKKFDKNMIEVFSTSVPFKAPNYTDYFLDHEFFWQFSTSYTVGGNTSSEYGGSPFYVEKFLAPAVADVIVIPGTNAVKISLPTNGNYRINWFIKDNKSGKIYTQGICQPPIGTTTVLLTSLPLEPGKGYTINVGYTRYGDGQFSGYTAITFNTLAVTLSPFTFGTPGYVTFTASAEVYQNCPVKVDGTLIGYFNVMPGANQLWVGYAKDGMPNLVEITYYGIAYTGSPNTFKK